LLGPDYPGYFPVGATRVLFKVRLHDNSCHDRRLGAQIPR